MFDFEPFEYWDLFWRNEELDASGDAGLTSDKTRLEGDGHLVNRWRADKEVALHVGFGGGAPEVRVGVNEGKVLALLFGEALRAGSASGLATSSPSWSASKRT